MLPTSIAAYSYLLGNIRKGRYELLRHRIRYPYKVLASLGTESTSSIGHMRVDVLEIFVEASSPPGFVRPFDSFPTGGFTVINPEGKVASQRTWLAENQKERAATQARYRAKAKLAHPDRQAEYTARYMARKKATKKLAAASTETA